VFALVLVPVRTILTIGMVLGAVFCVLSRLSCPYLLAGAGGGTLRQADAVLRAAVRQVGVADRPDRAGRLLVLAAVVLLATILRGTVLLATVLRGTVLLAAVVRVAVPVLA
jgi:hypothetical protein